MIASGSNTFRGIILQAHKADGTRIGTFATTDDNVQVLHCDGEDSATEITHTDRNDKWLVTATWTPPDDSDELEGVGDVRLV